MGADGHAHSGGRKGLSKVESPRAKAPPNRLSTILALVSEFLEEEPHEGEGERASRPPAPATPASLRRPPLPLTPPPPPLLPLGE